MDSNKQDAMPCERDMELLSQYLDGELPAAASRELEKRLHADATLQSALLRMQELNHRLRDALAEHETIPAAVTALLAEADQAAGVSDNVLPFPGAARHSQSSTRPRWAYALAASFVGATALVMMSTMDRSPESSLLPGNDALVSTALDQQQSGSGWHVLGDGREIQPVLTFAHEDGRWCREYLLRGGPSDWRAVACRADDQWVTQAAGLESYLEANDGYRPAGAGDAAPVAVFISQHAADIALGRAAEEQLIGSRWSH